MFLYYFIAVYIVWQEWQYTYTICTKAKTKDFVNYLILFPRVLFGFLEKNTSKIHKTFQNLVRIFSSDTPLDGINIKIINIYNIGNINSPHAAV